MVKAGVRRWRTSRSRDQSYRQLLHELYTLSDPACTTRVTVPTLWDTQTQTVVSNESSEIIRMFDTAFVDVAAPTPVLCPDDQRDEIDSMNDFGSKHQ